MAAVRPVAISSIGGSPVIVGDNPLGDADDATYAQMVGVRSPSRIDTIRANMEAGTPTPLTFTIRARVDSYNGGVVPALLPRFYFGSSFSSPNIPLYRDPGTGNRQVFELDGDIGATVDYTIAITEEMAAFTGQTLAGVLAALQDGFGFVAVDSVWWGADPAGTQTTTTVFDVWFGDPVTYVPVPRRRYPRADRSIGVTRSYPRPSRRSHPRAP